ncbi:MAG: hypothetical protein WC733_08820 [Methylophilus sp.]|jgi:hypothetical protein
MLQKSYISIALLSVTLLGCSTVNNLNPFDNGVKELAKTPANATQYICDGNKQFFVRMLNNGNDAWLMYPDREINLTRVADSNTYKAAAISLEINADQVLLSEGDNPNKLSCKAQIKK